MCIRDRLIPWETLHLCLLFMWHKTFKDAKLRFKDIPSYTRNYGLSQGKVTHKNCVGSEIPFHTLKLWFTVCWVMITRPLSKMLGLMSQNIKTVILT